MTSNWENRTHMSTQTFEPKPSPSANLVQIGSIEDVIQQRLAEERARLEKEAGLVKRDVHQFKKPVERLFTKDERAHTTLLFGGLTWKHEKLVHGALERNTDFLLGILNALNCGDVRNEVAHALRPYEIEAGATDKALDYGMEY